MVKRNIDPEDLSKKQLCRLAREVTKDSFRVYEENVLLLAENVDLKAGINSGADRYAKLWAENKRLLAAIGLALVLGDIESIKEVLEPWAKP